ncbi:MAG TPA: mechanosensitive ion channel family protein [Gemmatimonadota bacterium]|nr:mechanosensitive ion channel family protein [Gemmatimonadota bacterium]
MESLATLVPFEVEVDWARVVGSALRVVAILLIGALAYVVLRVVRNRVGRMSIEAGPGTSDRLQRRKTLASVMTTAGLILIAAVTLMMVLDTVGLPLGPLLATAGVASLAIGFGAQTLVKDIIGGFFILLEDQYSIGDVVQTAGVDGVVEEVKLRTTILRDVHGTVHVVPNGEIRVLSNKTKGWSRAVLEIGVGYREDPDRVIAILEELAAEIAEDTVFGALLLETPTVPGVEAFGDSAVTIRMMAKTLPLKQWDVARELRRRIKHRFDAEGIEMPFPQRTVWHRRLEGDPADDPASVGGGQGS